MAQTAVYVAQDDDTIGKGAFKTVQEAYDSAKPNGRIKFTPGVYCESVVIRKPGITIEPVEKSLDVTIRQEVKPCFIIDIGPEETCTINNLKMILTGPNKELDMKAYQENVQYDMYGSANVIREFYIKENMYTIIMVKSGILKMNNCILSLDGCTRETHRKVPCIVSQPNSSLEIFHCNFKGDTLQDSFTTGILSLKSDTTIHECSFAHFNAGAIMVDTKPENNIVISENIIMSCQTAGIFIQGVASRPQVQGNKIRFCKCSAIISALDVDAYIVQNEIQICGIGIEVQNNESKLFDNTISKSHEYGIQIVGDNNKTRSMPLIWRNKIEQCAFDGIIVFGSHCEPDIRGNIIANNRKSGIKIMKNAIAHIGGKSKEDIMTLPEAVAEEYQLLRLEQEQIAPGEPLPPVQVGCTVWTGSVEQANQTPGQPMGGTSFTQGPGAYHAPGPQNVKKMSVESLTTLQAIHQESPQLDNKYFRNQMTMKYLSNYIDGTFKLKSFPNSNVIRYNYNQGILIVEGSWAEIIGNKIDANIKANIAVGGENSGKTKIKYNLIENSKSEGIFVIEGQDKLIIEENTINNNYYGIVLIDSKGIIKHNLIVDNYTCGILTEKETTALISNNHILKNMTTGIIIKDPSLPDLRSNKIEKNNMFQLQMEAHAKRKWIQYQTDNPEIQGESVIPKTLVETCTIF